MVYLTDSASIKPLFDKLSQGRHRLNIYYLYDASTGYEAFQTFKAIAPEVAAQYGETVIATGLSNSEYNSRYAKFAMKNNMKPPPGAGRHKFMGWLVVRKYGTTGQHETWMPEEAFEECYELCPK